MKKNKEEDDSIIKNGAAMKGKIIRTKKLPANEMLDEEPKEKPKEESSDRIADLEKQVQILRDTAREDRLLQADEKHLGKKKSLPTGHLKYLQGKLIVKWYGLNELDDKGNKSKTKQEIIYHNNVAQGEKLIGHYVTIDGEDIVCDTIEFTRGNNYEYFDRISGTKENWIIKFHNKELANKYPDYEINIKYINP